MTFPATPRIILGELNVGTSDWVNITSDIQQRDTIQITRGRTDNSSNAAPARCTLTLNNRLGRYSPDNPNSPLYDLLVRNSPLRVSVGRGAYGMVVNNSNGRAECNDSAALSFTSDIDVRVDMELLAAGDLVDSPADWTTGAFDLASKFDDSVGSRGWSFLVVAGKLRFNWFPTGTTPVKTAESTVALPGPASGRRAVRVVLDVDNGAAGYTATFYTATTISGPWTMLGSAVTVAGVTTLFDTPAKLRIGSGSSTTSWTHGHMVPATVYSAELRGGVGAGTVFASPSFSTQPLDPVPFSLSSFNDAQGNSWSFNGTADAARIWYGDLSVRFVGELVSLPRKWDVSGRDAWVPAEAAGQTRRLDRGTKPVATGFRDYVLANPSTLVSYFPLDGDSGTTYSINLGPVGNNSYRFYPVSTGTVRPVYSYGVDLTATPGLGSVMELNATGDTAWLRADVKAPAGDNFTFDFVWQSPAMGQLTIDFVDSNGGYWELQLQDSSNLGIMHVSLWESDGNSHNMPDTVVPELLDTDVHLGRFQVRKSGSDSIYEMWVDGVSVASWTMPGVVWTGLQYYRMRYSRFTGQTVMNIGDLTVWAAPGLTGIPAIGDIYTAMLGYVGETAAARMIRIAAAGNIPIEIIGDQAATQVMGSQHSEGKLSQIRDAADTDLGILTEPRDDLGLLYRSLNSMYSQTPAFTLDYSLHQVADPFEPVDDDQNTRNIVTAVRRDGGSYRLEKTTGPLSTGVPPAGVGEYEDEVTVNVQTEELLPVVASWLLATGTVTEPRYRTLSVNLANPNVVAAGLEASVLACEVGDLIRVTNADNAFIYDDVNLLAIGYTERLNWKLHEFDFNCDPASPYEVFTVEDTGSRISSGETSLTNATMTTTGTSMKVLAADAVTLWTTSAGQMPISIMVAGEEMTVTAISGTTPGTEQTFTVTRSVNSVVKTHAVGEVVRLKRRAILAL